MQGRQEERHLPAGLVEALREDQQRGWPVVRTLAATSDGTVIRHVHGEQRQPAVTRRAARLIHRANLTALIRC